MTLAPFVRPVVVADLGESVTSAAKRLRDEHVGCIVVTRKGHPIGIVTDRDLALRVVAEGLSPTATRIDEVLTFDPITVSVSDSVESATRTMKERGVRRLPIIDDTGAIVGIVTADDLMVDLGRQLAAVGEAISMPTDAEDSR